MLHGNKSGHLLIYIGSKIVVIDFKVFESKEYTFFIEDELCRVVLERKGDKMFYSFEIDKKADTPRNRFRKTQERRFTRQMFISLGIFIAAIVAFTIWNPFEKSKLSHADELLMRQGAETTGAVLTDSLKSRVVYRFVAQNRGQTGVADIRYDSLILLGNGMPLESGDEFTIIYVPSRPEISRINFNKPTSRQIELYKKRAVEKYRMSHAEEAQSMIECMINIACQLEGISGIADFYFQGADPLTNPQHNQETFRRLMESLPFQKKLEQECQ